jgi:predicted transposase/invertase (TIGR01784 family)
LFNKPGPLKVFIPDFKFLLLDISHEPDENIKGIPILQILLTTLKYIFKPDIKNKLPEIIQLFKEIKNKNTSLDYLVALINYLVSAAGNLDNEEIEVTVSKVFSEGGEIMATIAEKLINQGIEQGIEQGIDQGIDKGKWDVVMNMLREGASIDFISKVTGFTAHQIKEFKEKIKEQQENAAA